MYTIFCLTFNKILKQDAIVASEKCKISNIAFYMVLRNKSIKIL